MKRCQSFTSIFRLPRSTSLAFVSSNIPLSPTPMRSARRHRPSRPPTMYATFQVMYLPMSAATTAPLTPTEATIVVP